MGTIKVVTGKQPIRQLLIILYSLNLENNNTYLPLPDRMTWLGRGVPHPLSLRPPVKSTVPSVQGQDGNGAVFLSQDGDGRQ
jgi:hypothetical protein